MEREYYYRVKDFTGDVIRPAGGIILETQVDPSDICMYELLVVRRTKHGVWLDTRMVSRSPEKFVLDGKGKRFAHATKKEAMSSFLRRKARQILILTRQLAGAKSSLKQAQAPGFEPEMQRDYYFHVEP
jgi:hypothetical protein